MAKLVATKRNPGRLEYFKLQKKKRSLKAGRLIVRNLSFKATEDDVIQLFSTYGNVQEVVLLRRQQKLVGCCFVQFQNKASAAKAIAKTSGKPFLGRQIIVDWAVSKKKYGSSGENKETKLEPVENIIKEEIVDQELSQDDTSVKSEGKSLANKRIKTKQKCYNGVSDERTLFIRNLPFSASNDDFRKCVETFGNVCYSLICVNPVSQLSNGTAFVRFEDIKSATACLNAGNALKLDGVVLQPHLALPKDQLPKKEEHKIKDNRNLYLAKEGVIIAGTPAASGVSASDMSKRLSLELWKSQSLRNSCMFVSKTRLVVHNLPPNCDNKMLMTIFSQNGPRNTAPIKAIVMRHLKDVDSNGIGRSKGFGFVQFRNHYEALESLRAVNNNPNIFSKSARPIVSFAIENSTAIKIKERRLQKSKRNNGRESSSLEIENRGSDCNPGGTDMMSSAIKQFAGINANIGSRKIITKNTLKRQASVHRSILKKEKSTKKSIKKKPGRMRKVEGKNNIKSVEPEDNFSLMIGKYMTKIDKSKKKWYE